MIGQTNKSMTAVLIAGFLVLGLWGCGSDHDNNQTDALAMLEPSIQHLDARLQTHYDTVTGVLNSAQTANGGTLVGPSQRTTEVQELALINEDWDVIHTEWDHYGRDMHRILNELGETLTMVGTCQMMMGDMIIGDQHAEDSCPCEPYVDGTYEELEQHLSQMLTWIEQENPSGLLGEMNRHWEQMGSHVEDMHSHMQQTYGSHGGMMGMM